MMPIGFLLILVASALIIFAFLTFPSAFTVFFWLVSLGVLGFVIYLALRIGGRARNAIFLLVVLEFFAVFYFACEIQVGSSLTLFISDCVRFLIGNWQVPTQTYIALEPIFFILLTPIFNVIWKYVGKSYASPIFRINLGLLFGAGSFILFAFSANISAYSTAMAVFWIVTGNALLGAGELCIGPTMISAVTKLAPAKWQGTFMGIWWFAISFSYCVGNLFISNLMTKHHSTLTTKEMAYQNAFTDLAVIIFGAFLVLACLGILFKCFWGKKSTHLLE